jgi:hypothetical protein
MKMLQPVRIAAVAATMFLAAAANARAADTVTADDTARFLAGMAPSPDSPLTPLTRDPAWQRHAKLFDSAFAQLEQRQLSKIRSWAETNLAAPRPTMFYMFSGPDFLYADACPRCHEELKHNTRPFSIPRQVSPRANSWPVQMFSRVLRLIES